MKRDPFCSDFLVEHFVAVERLIVCVYEAEDPTKEKDGEDSNTRDGF